MAFTKSSSDRKSFRFKPAPLSLKLPPAVCQRLRSTCLPIGSLATKAEKKGFLLFIGRPDGHAKRFRPAWNRGFAPPHAHKHARAVSRTPRSVISCLQPCLP